jgi:hypothetical protein
MVITTRTLDFDSPVSLRYDIKRGESPTRFATTVERRSKKMKRTIYFALMSVFFGVVVGLIVTNVVNILYPDFGLELGLAITFFTALTWGLLSLLGLVLDRPGVGSK